MAIPELKDSADRLTDCIYFGDPLSASVGSGFVPTNRTISTTAPLAGGGDLSANRTFAINDFAGSVAGAVPPSLGGVVTFLRADGAWATPPTFGAAAVGYAPASGGGVVNYLRADGTWAPPAGTGIAGLTVGLYPVADSATSIADGRIENISDGIRFHAAYTSAGDYKAIQTVRDNVNGLYYIQPADFDGATTFTTGLLLAAQGATANVQMLSEKFVVAAGLAFAQEAITFANGLNSNAALPSPRLTPFLRATGPTGAFSVGGFTKTISASPYDSELIYVFNTTSQAMTIVNEDVLSSATQRIWTGTGANVEIPAAFGIVSFVYSDVDSRWIFAGSSHAPQYPRTAGQVPYQDASGNLSDSNIYFDSVNKYTHFAPAISLFPPTVTARVDIDGTLATRFYNQALGNGLNSNIPAPTTSYMRVTGPTGAFSVGGVIIVTGENGKRLTIHNTTAQAMTIVHEDASSTAANRINTLTAANVVFPARQSVVHLIYSTTTSRWILDEANANTAGGATTQVQHNLAGALSGDTGLVVAGTGTAKTLTLGTDVTFARKTTRHLELGTPNAAPAAYILAGNSSIGGTDSNKVGGKLSIGGGAGTGTGGGGDTSLMTAYPGVLGNTQNTHVDRLAYAASPVVLTDSTATASVNVGVPTETGSGGTFWYTIYATDGTDMQIRRGRVEWAAVNKASAITIALGTPEEVDGTPVGTLTVTVTATDLSDDTFDFELNAVSSLTETTLEAWASIAHDGKGALSFY